MSITDLKSRLAASFRNIINDTAERLVEAKLATIQLDEEAIASRVAEKLAADISPESVAEHIDISAVAANVDCSDIAGEFSASDIASELDLSCLAGELDYSSLADYVDAQDVASHMDASDVADYFDASDLASEFDKEDMVKALAGRLSPLEQLAAQGVKVVDEDAIAQRAAEVALTAVVEVVETITAPQKICQG